MKPSPESLRTVSIYAAILMVSAILGCIVAAGSGYDSIAFVMVVGGLLVSPLILKGHQAMLFMCWNATLGLNFFSSGPPVWALMTVVSLGLSVLGLATRKYDRLLNVPVFTWPVAVFAAVIVGTMMANGGLGLQSMGSGNLSGGAKYVWVLGACLGYFAMTVVPVPPEKARFYYGLYCLGGVTGFVGPLVAWIGGPLSYLQYLFNSWNGVMMVGDTFRIQGLMFVGEAIVGWMLARYGFGGIFHGGRPWRALVFIGGILVGTLSGARHMLVYYVLTTAIVFLLEGLHRTSKLWIWLGAGTLGMGLLVLATPHLPTPVQRSLAILPLPVDPTVRLDSEGTIMWREQLWGMFIQEVPRYFWLGKGMAVSTTDMELRDVFEKASGGNLYGSYIVNEHHNGLIGVLLPYGIWGLLSFIWLLWAGIWVLAHNFRHGSEALRHVNAFALAAFLAWIPIFFTVQGTLHWQLKNFTGLVGLSVALNHGLAGAAQAVQTVRVRRRRGVFPTFQPEPAPQSPRLALTNGPAFPRHRATR